jgi:Flp pilus assembly protein TadG
VRLRRQTHGQAMLEFALIFPLILLLILMFIELGRVVYYYSALNNAVREGARYAIVRPFPSSEQRLADIRQRVSGYAIWLPLVNDDIGVYCDQDPGDNGNPCEAYVTVSAAAEIAPMAAFIARILGAGSVYRLTAQSTMQMTPFGSQ